MIADPIEIFCCVINTDVCERQHKLVFFYPRTGEIIWEDNAPYGIMSECFV